MFDILEPLFDAVAALFINVLGKFPLSPFQFDDYLQALRGYLGHLNYFIPFYLCADLWNIWLIMIASLTVVYFIYRTIGKHII